MSDGSILRILDALITVDGEKLSYRTLDVEQIGSVYETVMGFTIETRAGPAVAIKAGKNDRTPVFVDLAALGAVRGTEQAKFLKEEAGRNALSDKVAKGLAAAKVPAEALDALRPIIDERGSPGGHVSPPGTPLLQPTDERRRTGSHYTPRSLTEPIVRHALEPAFEHIGPDARPEDVLALKVCDPAMGSGAFLVEACRALGDRLVRAWARWPETRPKIPEDEDEPLHARRLVAQRCLYGVDKNPRAVELAKLSLWLATLARDHEFTFLDHALKCGDSLVGLDAKQIAAMHWDLAKPGLPLFRKFVADRVAEATKARAEIQSAPDDTARAVLEAKHRAIESFVADVRVLGDAVISAFFAEDKPKAREKRRATIESWVAGSPARWDELRTAAASLRTGEHPLTPFHWAVEFPEVVSRENGGFDAIVGNPPFAGKNTTIAGHRAHYLPWLQTLHAGSHGNSDLVAHFFRRAFRLLRESGVFGLIATNTIGQGDTRDTGLATILGGGGAIAFATRRLKWPGEAAVVVSIVHVKKGTVRYPILDGHHVKRISAYLVDGELDHSPALLASNNRSVFKGSELHGAGFMFDDEGAAKGQCESISTMNAIISSDPRNAERIFPFLTGQDVVSDPKHSTTRYAIDLNDLSAEEAQSTYPILFNILMQRVLPQRRSDNRASRRLNWWRYGERSSGLYLAIKGKSYLLCTTFTSPHMSFCFIRNSFVFANMVIIFPDETPSGFGVLQSRTHEVWARFFASSLKDDLRYTPSDCFRTFPFPEDYRIVAILAATGHAYHDHRAALMVARNEGMTKTYNRFHDPAETAVDIERLRDLHAAMDHAVLESYGWNELADRAEPIFLDETNEDDHTYSPASLKVWRFSESLLPRGQRWR